VEEKKVKIGVMMMMMMRDPPLAVFRDGSSILAQLEAVFEK
jgi:hypothetical protein